jgi:hypothetical protein
MILRELPDRDTIDPATPFLLLTFSNAAATTCFEVAYGFEPGSFIRLLPGTPVDHQRKPG